MDDSIFEQVWRHAREGRHCAVVGQSRVPVTRAAAGMLLVRTTCEGPPSTWGPLEEARTKILSLLGEPNEPADDGRLRSSFTTSPRARLLGKTDAPASVERFVQACNRLVERSGRPSALVIDGVDAADDATVRSLAGVLRRVGWLRLPLVLGFRASPAGAAADLLSAVRASGGDEAIVSASEAPERRRGEREDATSGGFDWSKLPPDALRVVRAGAAVGTVFEIELVAALLDVPVHSVLDSLQRAVDMGAPIADGGEGRISLPPGATAVLSAMTMPSMLSWWHRRLAALLGPTGGAREQHASRRDAPNPGPARAPASPTSFEQLFDAPAPSSSSSPRVGPNDTTATERSARPVGSRLPPPAAPSAQPTPSPAPPSPPLPAPAAPARVVGDAARAAQHLSKSQNGEAACERYLAAADEVASRGDATRAAQLALAAIDAISSLPSSDARDVLRANALLHIGRAQSQGASAGAGDDTTLQGALQTLSAARAALPANAPARLVAELAAAIATVRYDIGDTQSLDGALGELTQASRLLLDAGDPQRAAQLLNDQAAVYLRLGDPVRAMSLLERSRQIFEDVRRERPDDPVATHELAETDHLVARVLLHARPRPGRETDAYALGVDYALAAERVHRAAGRRRELARVWETLARLETKRGRLDRALERATQAAGLQSAIGDVTGLARTTAALADVLAAGGQSERAASVLSESIALNVEQGSPIGLAFNRRAFDALRGRVASEPQTGHTDTTAPMAQLEQHLEAAEKRLGRLVLPGETAS